MESKSKIQCPSCKFSFSVTDVMAEEMERELEKKFQAKLETSTAMLKEKEKVLQREKEAIEKAKESMDETLKKMLQKEKSALEAKVKESLAKEMLVEVGDLKAQIQERDKRADEMAKNEIELRKKSRELEEREKRQELDLQRKLDTQKVALEEDLRKRLDEEFQLKSAEKELKLEGMRKQIEELKRKSEQGSEQTQGEVLELEVERILTSLFPMDHTTPIAKGIKGGDILQQVNTRAGQEIGKILYETKNTKAWSDGWIQKAKDDQREAKAEFVVLISSALPREMKGFGFLDGIWVTDFDCFQGLVVALRHQMTQVYFAKSAAAGKDAKLDNLYQYMTGTQLRQRVEAIVDGFRAMKEGLETEKRGMMRIWANREKNLERVLTNTAGLYGDIQGIIGASLPKIESLELDIQERLPGTEAKGNA